MAKRKAEGHCAICSTYGPLTFEHVPPEKAFNDRPVVMLAAEKAMNLAPGERAKGPIQQRGMGAYTLCGKCNNDTGGWYGGAFVDWCAQGMDILRRAGGRPTLIYPHHIYPLRIFKQIITMFFSANPGSLRHHSELVTFVLDKERQYLSPTYRVFVYYNNIGRTRFHGLGGLLNVEKGTSILMSEITFPPFGYVLTLDSPPPDQRLVEVTYFARSAYDAQIALPFRLPVLPTHVWVPGDYREHGQIMKEAAESAMAMASPPRPVLSLP